MGRWPTQRDENRVAWWGGPTPSSACSWRPDPGVRRGRGASAPHASVWLNWFGLHFRCGELVLFPDHEDRERIRQHRTSRGPASSSWRRSRTGRRRRWRRSVLGGHGHDAAGLRIERQRLCAHHRVEILLYLEGGGTRLLHDGHRPVTVRAEGFHGGRVEERPSELPASGRTVRILPSLALRMTILGSAGCAGGAPEFRAATNRTRFFTSIASPASPLPLSPRS